ncbi:hypothetical protein [Alkalihalobacterium chitinilyticum]|uniref:J domain-containing protein n=1 Tax=Alkalihalobacterium chitinilyticum TaxID=2980103 RepID=A0ABT5VFL0_9BACI|nr:hypothetical protein [Alkalihalobacterium chitinilyticum]MDE5414236.1 hypothetical protein [Alkalihalobacterium chitinilyticum]
MEESKKRMLIQLLREQHMYYVIALLDEGADDQEILDAFEKSVLYANPNFQSLKLNMNNQNQMFVQKTIDHYKKYILNRPEYRRVYEMLGKPFDCGCS